MHERDVVHNGLANADDHDGPAPANGVAGGAYAALNTGALNNGSRHRVLVLAIKFPDIPRGLLSAQLCVDLVGLAARNKLLRELQSLGHDIRDY